MSTATNKVQTNMYRQSQDQKNQDGFVVFVLSNDGTIIDTNPEGMELLGFSPDQLDSTQHHISNVLPKLGEVDLLAKKEKRINPYLRFLSRIGHKFEVNASNGKQYGGELYFNDINNTGEHQILVMCKTQDQAF